MHCWQRSVLLRNGKTVTLASHVEVSMTEVTTQFNFTHFFLYHLEVPNLTDKKAVGFKNEEKVNSLLLHNSCVSSVLITTSQMVVGREMLLDSILMTQTGITMLRVLFIAYEKAGYIYTTPHYNIK